MYKKVFIIIVTILLVAGNIYFYNQSKKLDYRITVGKPVGNDYATMGIDLYDKPLSNKDEYNLLIFSLINGTYIEKPEVCEKLPDLQISFNDWEENIEYSIVNFWINEDSVVIELNGQKPDYRIIEGSRATDLKKIIERYPNKTYK